MQQHCNAEAWSLWRSPKGVEVLKVGVEEGYKHSVRLPVLAHPALPISCLLKIAPASH